MFISATLRDGILFLTFDDKVSRNAFSLSAARELLHHIGHTQFSALVFSATGRVFCSGGQLSDYASMTSADEGRQVNSEIRKCLEGLATLDRPTIVAVGGDVFGGGVELVSCFDVVLAAPHVMFGLWQRKIGLSYGWGGGARLEKRMGSAALKRLALSTEAICSHEAADLGLIDSIVQESDLILKAEQTARALLALPLEPVETLKSFDESDETGRFNKLWWNPSHRSVLAHRKRS